jgi:hypothetical protein
MFDPCQVGKIKAKVEENSDDDLDDDDGNNEKSVECVETVLPQGSVETTASASAAADEIQSSTSPEQTNVEQNDVKES